MERKKKLFVWIVSGIILLIALVLVLVFAILPLFDDNENGESENDRLFDIVSVAIQVDGATATNLLIPLGTQNFRLTALINDGAEINADIYYMPTVEWSFVGRNLGNTISNEGLVDLSNTILGEATVRVSVTSRNTMTADASFIVTPKENSTLVGLELTTPPTIVNYEEGLPFDRMGMVVTAIFDHSSGEYSIVVENFSVTPEGSLTVTSLGNSWQIEVSFTHDGVTFSFPIGITLTRTLESISVIPPPRTTYVEGQRLDLTGMQVFAHYKHIQRELSSSEFVVDFDLDSELTTDTNSIRVVHLGSGLSATFNIIVEHRRLTSISVSGYQTNFILYQRFSIDTIIAYANFNYGESYRITNFTVSNTNRLTLSDSGTNILISYTVRGVTVQYIVPITVRVPYDPQNIRLITIDGIASNVSVSWIFIFTGSDGEEIIDYQTHEYQELLFDPVLGKFEVPAQAIVTIRKVNPSIIDFSINGAWQDLDLAADTTTFVVGDEDIVIAYETVTGDRVTVRFVNERGDSLIFYFSVNWTGRLLPAHLERINFRFYETEAFVYEFRINGNVVTFEDFATYEERTFLDIYGQPFTINVFFLRLNELEDLDEIVIEVTQIQRPAQPTRNLTLKFWTGFQTNVTVLANVPWQEQVQAPHRTGFEFRGWEHVIGDTYRAIWKNLFGDVDYTGQPIVGEWKGSHNGINVNFVFTEEGNFIFRSTATVLMIDSPNLQKDYILHGIFRLENDEIIIKTVDTEFDFALTQVADFSLELINGNLQLRANVFIVTIIEIEEDIEIEEGVFETIRSLVPNMEIVELVLSM